MMMHSINLIPASTNLINDDRCCLPFEFFQSHLHPRYPDEANLEFDDTNFSDPIAQVATNADGSYTFLTGHFLTGHDYADYLNSPVIVRSMFESKMTPEQVAEAQRLAQEWKPKTE